MKKPNCKGKSFAAHNQAFAQKEKKNTPQNKPLKKWNLSSFQLSNELSHSKTQYNGYWEKKEIRSKNPKLDNSDRGEENHSPLSLKAKYIWIPEALCCIQWGSLPSNHA